ncbi:MAG: hypothetical protein IPL88_12430 [Rhizobiales bacterium]|nr:hypothetical protein [Hyphomicrobiales bacterium]
MRLPVLVATLAALIASQAQAEVRFGRNVRIGGHDFSHQTYGPKRSAVIHLYDRRPARQGCRWIRRPGGMTRVCHLKTRR